MFGIESGEAQALRWSSIFASTYLSIEKPINKLCDRTTHLNQLEKRQLQLHSSHRWTANEDGSL